ncbi:MAG: hypothetical protein L0Y76_01565 [Ignavibacteria bacterium]|nr:hypothetical protein [Ignavibacteria bacterium]
MKQKEYLLSSLLIAFVAGFIYYAFADTDIIKKIPTLAYQTILSVTDNRESTGETRELNTKVIGETKNDLNGDELSNPTLNSLPINAAFSINIPDFSNFIKVQDFGGGIISFSGKELPEKYHSGDFGFHTSFGDDMIEYAGYYDAMPLDSNERRVRIKIHNMDSLNITLNEMVSKLNESIEKMTEQFRSEEFMKNFKDFDDKNFEVHIDADEIKAEIDESMKDFNEEMEKFNQDMEEFQFDMKELQDSMKKMNEEMKGLKDSMKNIDSVKYNKRFRIKVDTIET